MLIKEKISNLSTFIFFLGVCIIISQLQAQDSTGTISSIVIIGNEITGDNVIQRELLLKVGDEPKLELIEESRQRLMNLLLFNRVEMNLYPQNDGGFVLLIELTERLYFYPVEGTVFFHAAMAPDGSAFAIAEMPFKHPETGKLVGTYQVHLVR